MEDPIESRAEISQGARVEALHPELPKRFDVYRKSTILYITFALGLTQSPCYRCKVLEVPENLPYTYPT